MDVKTLSQALANLSLDPALTDLTATRLMIANYFLHRFDGHVVAKRMSTNTS